ncbi:MAG: hypothetical protein J6K83_06830 [Bacteroidaceae bacterium]|nr:hypothetical protein [Bacteroidaceae bacterium]MBP3408842.1 hypothetical protein [Bacteroidaceae bacterium]
MKKIYKSPAIEAVEIEINSIMQARSGGYKEDVEVGDGQDGKYDAGRDRGFGNLWGDN